MTVSDYARNRRFFCRIAIAILLGFTMFQSRPALAQKTESFAARCLVPGWSLHIPAIAKRYGITRLRWGPGSKALLPGDQYTISYRVRVEAEYLDYCSDVLKTTWTIHAVLGTDASAVRPARVIGTYISQQHSSSVDARRDVTFTVPDPATLGADPGQDIVTVTIGVCPEYSSFSCASHTLKISTGSRSGYKISAPRPTTRAIGQGQNRVAANRPFTLKVDVKNIDVGRNEPLPRFLTLTQRRGRGVPEKRISFLRPARGISSSFQFPMGVLRPGQYAFTACLTDERGYPNSDKCSPEAVVNVGAALTGLWQVGGVQVNALGTPSSSTSALSRFRLQTTIFNMSQVNNPSSGNTIVMLVRRQGRSDIPSRSASPRGPIAAGQTLTKFISSAARAAGQYEFKACIADSPQAATVDMICGPWSPITIGDRVLPTPQPAPPAPTAASPDPAAASPANTGNATSRGWQVSILKPLQRAIGAGINRVPPNRPIILGATITRPRAWPEPGQGPVAVIRQITSTSGPVSTTALSTQSVAGIKIGESGNLTFAIKPFVPGVYGLKACVTGLKQGRWPAPDVCGPPTAITVGVPAAGTWKVGSVSLGRRSRIDAGTPFSVFVPVDNLSSTLNPIGGRYLSLLQRKFRSGAVPVRIMNKTLGDYRPRAARLEMFGSVVLNRGQFELRACLSGDRNFSQVNSVCGPWSLFTSRTPKVRPAPQPVAPGVRACTGGRSKNATGRCVCPRGTKWSQGARRCANALQAVPTPVIRLPALGAQRTIRCTGGTVSNGACLCPRGFKRSKLKANTFVCKPPFKRPLPGAGQSRPNAKNSAPSLQNQLKKPKASKLRCLGGQVRGPLCWCGIGKFPQKIGNNTYRCQ